MKNETKIYIIEFLGIALIGLFYLSDYLSDKKRTEDTKKIAEKLEQELEIEPQEQQIEKFKDKGEIQKPMGAVILISKINLADLKLTETDYDLKKIQLITDYNNGKVKLEDKERFVAMLNYEIQKWKTVNKRPFILNDITDKNLITKILNKTQ